MLSKYQHLVGILRLNARPRYSSATLKRNQMPKLSKGSTKLAVRYLEACSKIDTEDEATIVPVLHAELGVKAEQALFGELPLASQDDFESPYDFDVFYPPAQDEGNPAERAAAWAYFSTMAESASDLNGTYGTAELMEDLGAYYEWLDAADVKWAIRQVAKAKETYLRSYVPKAPKGADPFAEGEEAAVDQHLMDVFRTRDDHDKSLAATLPPVDICDIAADKIRQQTGTAVQNGDTYTLPPLPPRSALSSYGGGSCGAPTKSKRPCQRPVRAKGVRCWEH